MVIRLMNSETKPATGQNICHRGVNCALGLSKSICYSGVRYSRLIVFTYFTVSNSARLSNVVHYNGVFVIAGFVIAG